MHLTEHAEAMRKERALLTELDEEALEVRESALKVVAAIHKENKKKKSTKKDDTSAIGPMSRAWELLLLQMAMQQLVDVKESSSVLEELMEVHAKEAEKLKPAKKKAAAKKKTDEEEDDDEEEAESVEVLTDILLSLLLKSSGLLRDVVKRVFEAISGEVSQGAFGLLLRVIESKDGDDEVMGMSDDEDEESDEEMEPISDEGDEEKDIEEEEEEEEEEEDDDEEMAPVSLMQEQIGEDGDDDILIDDANPEVLAAYDEKLAAIFKTMKDEKKTSAKDMAKMQLHFKFRVLDLIEIYVKRQPTSPFLFDAVVPLMQAILTAQASGIEKKSLAERMSGILGKVCKTKDFARAPDVEVEYLSDILSELVKTATTAQANTTVAMASMGAQFVVKALLAGKTDATTSAGMATMKEAYAGALKDYMTRKNSRLTSKFFTDLIDRQPVAACVICEELIVYGEEGRSDYLKAEALRMSKELLKKTQLIKDSFDGARGKKLASIVKKSIEAVLDTTWSNAKRFREGLDFSQAALKFLVTIGAKIDGTSLAEKATKLADGESPSPAVIVGLKSLSNMLLGKTTVAPVSNKSKKKREREAKNAGNEEGVEEGLKSPKKKAKKSPKGSKAK